MRPLLLLLLRVKCAVASVVMKSGRRIYRGQKARAILGLLLFGVLRVLSKLGLAVQLLLPTHGTRRGR